MCSLGSAKKGLSSTVPSVVTMATPTGFSSCAALKNVRLTYNGEWPAHNTTVQPRLTVCCRFNSLGAPALLHTALLTLEDILSSQLNSLSMPDI